VYLSFILFIYVINFVFNYQLLSNLNKLLFYQNNNLTLMSFPRVLGGLPAAGLPLGLPLGRESYQDSLFSSAAFAVKISIICFSLFCLYPSHLSFISIKMLK